MSHGVALSAKKRQKKPLWRFPPIAQRIAEKKNRWAFRLTGGCSRSRQWLLRRICTALSPCCLVQRILSAFFDAGISAGSFFSSIVLYMPEGKKSRTVRKKEPETGALCFSGAEHTGRGALLRGQKKQSEGWGALPGGCRKNAAGASERCRAQPVQIAVRREERRTSCRRETAETSETDAEDSAPVAAMTDTKREKLSGEKARRDPLQTGRGVLY